MNRWINKAHVGQGEACGGRQMQSAVKSRSCGRRAMQNAGFSLLELIIAVSIFAIAAAILLQAFVTSGRINRKSGIYLDASTAAQNVMEEIKSEPFEEVALAFDYPVDATNGKLRLGFLEDQSARYQSGELAIKEMLKDGDSYRDVRLYHPADQDTSLVTASIISEDNGKTWTFNPRTTGKNKSKYYFQIAGLQSGSEEFDALVTFDGSTDSGYSNQTTSKTGTGKNDYEMPNISHLDTKTNAFLIMPMNWDENAMETIAAKQYEEAQKRWAEDKGSSTDKPQKLDVSDIYQQTKRTLYIKVDESGGTIKAEAKYTLNTYSYVKAGGGKYESMDICPCGGKADGLNGCFCTYESAYMPFYSSEAGSELKNLFIFYYPNYASTSTAHPLDEIVFENTSNYPLQLYVAKQRPDSQDGQDTALPTAAQEQKYRMALTVKESPSALGQTNWNTNPSLYRAKTVLRTNLDTNISNTDDVLTRTSVNQMRLVYQAVSKTGANEKKVSGRSAKQVLSVNGLDDREQADRIYAAKVEIYRAGAAAQNFPESERLVVLEGAKEN